MVFVIDLGINDTRTGTATSKATYKLRLQKMIDQILTVDWPTNGRVVLEYPTYFTPNVVTTFTYNEAGLELLQEYQAAIDELVAAYKVSNPGRVVGGTNYASAAFATGFKSYLTAEAGPSGTYYLHPNATGADLMGRSWAADIYNGFAT